MMRKLFSTSCMMATGLLTIASSAALAAIINVPGTHATVQAAVNAAAASGDEIVIAPGTYVGPVQVNGKSLTIRGSDANNRPILVLEQQPAAPSFGFQATGFLILGDGITVSVEDVITIPAPSNTPSRAFQTSTLTAGATITANFENILIAPNSGSNTPATTDPFADLTFPHSTDWSSDGMYLVNRAFLGTLLDGIGIYTLTDVTVIGAGRDGIVAYPSGPTSPGGGAGSSLTASGVKIAHSARHPIQWGDSNLQGSAYTITGTRANPGLLSRNNNRTTASAAGVNGINGAGVVAIDHLVHIDHTGAAGALHLNAGSFTSLSISKSLFANINDDGLALSGTAITDGPVGIDSSTFFACGQAASNTAGLWFGTVNPLFTISNSVFAGTTGHGGLIYNAGAGAKTTLNNNAIVAAGPNALTQGQFGSGAPATSETGTVTADPEFVSTTTTSLAALQTAFDVEAASYAGAGTSSSNLSGFGDYVGASSVGEWMLH
ncbi:MAG: hypothetical protein KF858_12085 [Candidatus Sumerlaeia bacterium]|nr:hypothetical protein [Candidatus Sumerlaeia bacterium]